MNFQERIRILFYFSLVAGRKAVKLGGVIVFTTSTSLTIAIPGIFASKRLQIPMVFEVRDLWPELPIAMGTLRSGFLIYLAPVLIMFAGYGFCFSDNGCRIRNICYK